MKLPQEFYLSDDVVALAKSLLGKKLCTSFQGKITKGIIVETEAYAGITDKASHAYNGRRTKRTETMYSQGGVAYVYLCYGVHALFNVVTNVENIPHAILIRGIFPTDGIETMNARVGKPAAKLNDFIGPGKVTKALGIDCSHDKISLLSDSIWIEDTAELLPNEKIVCGKRIGIDYAEEDAERPYRFYVEDFGKFVFEKVKA